MALLFGPEWSLPRRVLKVPCRQHFSVTPVPTMGIGWALLLRLGVSTLRGHFLITLLSAWHSASVGHDAASHGRHQRAHILPKCLAISSLFFLRLPLPLLPFYIALYSLHILESGTIAFRFLVFQKAQHGNHFMRWMGPNSGTRVSTWLPLKPGESRQDKGMDGEVLSYFLDFWGHGNKKCSPEITVAVYYFHFL